MEVNNLPKNLLNDGAKNRFRVMLLGFDTVLVERIKGIFKVGHQGNRTYCVETSDIGNKIDVLLINHDNPLSLHKKDLLLRTTCPHALVVMVSQGPIANTPSYHIRGMLTASRLLSILDKLPLQNTQKLEQKPDISVFLPQPVAPKQENIAVKPILETPSIVSAPETVSVETSGYRALVVDDSLAIQLSIKLKLQGIAQITTIDFADNGESALEKSMTTQYDLIFLDVMMPGIDGYETCTRLRKRPEYKKTPIIMVSGKTSPLDEVKGVMAGCTTYLSKPVDDQAFHKLSLRVLNWLADRKSVAAAT